MEKNLEETILTDFRENHVKMIIWEKEEYGDMVATIIFTAGTETGFETFSLIRERLRQRGVRREEEAHQRHQGENQSEEDRPGLTGWCKSKAAGGSCKSLATLGTPVSLGGGWTT